MVTGATGGSALARGAGFGLGGLVLAIGAVAWEREGLHREALSGREAEARRIDAELAKTRSDSLVALASFGAAKSDLEAARAEARELALVASHQGALAGAAKARLGEVETRAAEAEKRAAEASQRAEAAELKVADGEKARVDLERRARGAEALIEALRKKKLNVERLAGVEATPRVAAVVVEVDESEMPPVVVLNVGAKDQVAEGDAFTITRDGREIARLVVEKVKREICAARLQRAARGERVRSGDEAVSAAP